MGTSVPNSAAPRGLTEADNFYDAAVNAIAVATGTAFPTGSPGQHLTLKTAQVQATLALADEIRQLRLAVAKPVQNFHVTNPPASTHEDQIKAGLKRAGLYGSGGDATYADGGVLPEPPAGTPVSGPGSDPDHQLADDAVDEPDTRPQPDPYT